MRRSREVNIFSMSALDLFASALGAFIFITIMLLPYFMNTGKSDVEALEKALEEQTAKLEDLEKKNQAKVRDIERLRKELAEANAKAAKVSISSVDVVIVIDTTGSMKKEISFLKTQIRDLVNILNVLSDDVGIGIVAYKDRVEPTVLRSHPLKQVAENSVAFRNLSRFINTLDSKVRFNKDIPEALGLALRTAYVLQWRPHVQKQVVIVITDAPPYPEEEVRTLQEAQSFVQANPARRVAGISVGKAHGRKFLQRLSHVGKGTFIQGAVDISTILKLIID